jgi:hypothetical protein
MNKIQLSNSTTKENAANSESQAQTTQKSEKPSLMHTVMRGAELYERGEDTITLYAQIKAYGIASLVLPILTILLWVGTGIGVAFKDTPEEESEIPTAEVSAEPNVTADNNTNEVPEASEDARAKAAAEAQSAAQRAMEAAKTAAGNR